nr:hypothetical protein DGKKSRWO_DGKKSRWO_CDS_0092 [uncultured phage]CAI9752269.1 hypothetical protein CVNMHQAP_CVNMHQAP_CDS_0092 [uncultured phage]
MKIPESQFQVFTVEIDGVDKLTTLFQTFGDAYEYIARESQYATLTEVVPENDSFHIDYYATERLNYDNGSCKYLRHHYRITARLFTYDSAKTLITSNFFWLREKENKTKSFREFL